MEKSLLNEEYLNKVSAGNDSECKEEKEVAHRHDHCHFDGRYERGATGFLPSNTCGSCIFNPKRRSNESYCDYPNKHE